MFENQNTTAGASVLMLIFTNNVKHPLTDCSVFYESLSPIHQVFMYLLTQCTDRHYWVLTLDFSVLNVDFCVDKMGEEHNVRRTSRIPTFMVVVSVICLVSFCNVYFAWLQLNSPVCVFCSVFWDLYCAAPERRENCEHSSEAKAFHDYVSEFMDWWTDWWIDKWMDG